MALTLRDLAVKDRAAITRIQPTFIPSKERADARDQVRLPGGGLARLVMRVPGHALVAGTDGFHWIDDALIGKSQRELRAEGEAKQDAARTAFVAELEAGRA